MAYFRELIVWQKSMDLVKHVYLCTAEFPKDELYGITSQIRRAAVSIPSNIAEGCGRKSDKELSHFLRIENGSLYELETQLILCCNLGYTSEAEIREIMDLLHDVGRILNTMINRLSI